MRAVFEVNPSQCSTIPFGGILMRRRDARDAEMPRCRDAEMQRCGGGGGGGVQASGADPAHRGPYLPPTTDPACRLPRTFFSRRQAAGSTVQDLARTKMVKPLSFKGDKKASKKRKRGAKEADDEDAPASKALVPIDAAPEAEDDENWVSADSVDDIAGPVILVLPLKKVSCIAVDQLGTVFTSDIENMVENEASSAEPHEVRQVWISQKIVGTAGNFTFKGHHGKYLGCDKYGFLSSTREAVSPEETFTVTPSDSVPGTFNLSAYQRFLSVNHSASPAEIRGDAEAASDTTAIRIRMQARFKPKHKVEKAEKVRAKISRQELEAEVGRRLEDGEVKRLKKARREGNYHEAMLDVKVKGKHDKFA